MITLTSKLAEAIGARTANAIAKHLELVTVEDLLRYYPRDYKERGELTRLRDLEEGQRANVMARVAKSSQRIAEAKFGSKPLHLLTLTITDGTTEVTATFFNQQWLQGVLTVGTEALFSGTVKKFRESLQLSGPSAFPIGKNADEKIEQLEEFSGLFPVYALSEGIKMPVLQKSVKQVLAMVDTVPDPVPDHVLSERGLVDLTTALNDIHRPRSKDDLEAAKLRLAYDEALAMQLVFAQRREINKQYPAEPCPPIPDGLLAVFDENLPFALTDGQREVGDVISADLSTIHPMNRLLQGEVGSGKTVVALRAMLQVIDGGRQAVMLAPTEVLAAQHARSLNAILGPLARGGELGAPAKATRITLLTGSLGAAARKQSLLDIASGQAGIVVGTHALLGKEVFFANLGLVVVDEQHRFGVEQRDTLRNKHPAGNPPHVLVMTATPIPRTVAMTVYGDMETSILRQLPAGRSPITTNVVPLDNPKWMDRVWGLIREEVAKGRQAYVVCPRIGGDDEAPDEDYELAVLEPGEDLDDFEPDRSPRKGAAKPKKTKAPAEDGRRPPLAVIDVAEALRSDKLAGLRLAELTGRMTPADKDQVMGAFTAGQLDVLVATTVIEVGVDVPNATVIVVMDADRFGLSQVHQLRGRVGRGREPGRCLLVTEMSKDSPAGRRLAIAEETSDGFALAKADLEFRREGDILGTSQAGKNSSLRLLSMVRHEEQIGWARQDATTAVGKDPTLAAFPLLAGLVRAMFDEQDKSFLDKA